MSATCRSKKCGRPVLWASVEGSHKAIPLDPEPNEVGTVEVVARHPNGTLIVKVLTKVELTNSLLGEAPERYVPHYATCAGVEEFRP